MGVSCSFGGLLESDSQSVDLEWQRVDVFRRSVKGCRYQALVAGIVQQNNRMLTDGHDAHFVPGLQARTKGRNKRVNLTGDTGAFGTLGGHGTCYQHGQRGSKSLETKKPLANAVL